MIIVRIRGGLGNQMFQYAVARAMSLRLGSPFRLHVPRLQVNEDRPFELQCFRADMPIAGIRDFSAFTGGVLAIPLLRKRRHPQAIVEQGHNFDPRVVEARPPIYLDGYFQTERYFVEHRETLLADFTFATPPTGRNAELLAEIASCESVAIHVRRGDYVAKPHVQAHHGVTPLSYYEAAIAHINERVRDPRFFVFSDDAAWTKQHLAVLGPATFVDHNAAGFEDLRLLSACKHQVIANSSFSWWGAWLNHNPAKHVVAPRQWINKPPAEFADVYPAGTHRI